MRFIAESACGKFLKIGRIFGIVAGKKVDCVVHFLRLVAVSWPGAQTARDNHLLACNFAKYSAILNTYLKNFSVFCAPKIISIGSILTELFEKSRVAFLKNSVLRV